MLLANWDPVQYSNEEPSPTCLLKVKRHTADINADPLPGIFISPDEGDITRIHAIVLGPARTPYEGGFFHFFMKCPAAYPIDSPRVRLMTTDAGRVGFNPNLYADGKVCLSILGTWPGPAWSPAQGMGSVLVSIQSLLNEEPYYNEPGYTPGARPEASKLYNERVQNDTIRVDACDAVEGCLKDEPPCPRPLAEAILKVFAESYDKYEQKVRSLIKPSPVQPAVASSQIPGVACTPPSYETLLARLQELYKRVRDKTEAQAAAQTAAQAAAQATLQATEQASG